MAVYENLGPCIIHPNKPGKDGYVKIKVNGKTVSAHRQAYEHAHGPIPEGMVVRHKCDVRACVKPDHLEVGTHKQNMEDMRERGRAVPPSWSNRTTYRW